MTLIQSEPTTEEILPFIDDSVRQLSESGLDAAAIIVGPNAYAVLGNAIAKRFKRNAGHFRSYQYIPVLLDPLRGNSVCVLPPADEVAKGVLIEYQ